MPGKAITEEGLQKDLAYVLSGIDCHEVLAAVCPPRLGLEALEPGCGSGKLGLWYGLRGARVYLVDIDVQALKYAGELHNRVWKSLGLTSTSVIFLVRSIHKLPPNWNNHFDFVFNEGVPHHWGFNKHDWRRQGAINQMVRVTKPGGSVCVIGSNAHCPQTMAMAEATHHTYPGMPPRQKPFTVDELTYRLTKAGLIGVQTSTVPIGIPWHLSPLLAGWGRKP